jgi:hypothetical protein
MWWLDTNVSENHAASIFRVHFNTENRGSMVLPYPSTTLYGSIAQKTMNYIFSVVETSNLT